MLSHVCGSKKFSHYLEICKWLFHDSDAQDDIQKVYAGIFPLLLSTMGILKLPMTNSEWSTLTR